MSTPRDNKLLDFPCRLFFFLIRRTDYTVMTFLSSSLLYYYLEFRSYLVPTISDANPANPIWVDPNEIEYFHGQQAFGKNEFGYVTAGSWDRPECRFAETDRFLYIRKSIKEIKNHQEMNVDETILELYQAIKKDGYKSQRELLAQRPNIVQNCCNDAPHPVLNEIGVYIYRDGTIVKKGGGHHRLSIAKLLNISQVPVTVRVRHKKWQNIRNQVRQAESASELPPNVREYINHPDLVSIAPES